MFYRDFLYKGEKTIMKLQAGETAEKPEGAERKTYMPYKFDLQLFSEGESAPAESKAETTQASEERMSFDELIRGEYRDEFTEKVNSIIAKRFKSEKTAEEKLDEMNSSLRGAMEDFGVTSAKELAEKLNEGAKETESLKRRISAAESFRIGQMCDTWIEDALSLSAEYPEFDLAAEIENETFRNGLRLGIDLKTLYLSSHFDEVKNSLRQEAAAEAEEELRRNMNRPKECGAGAVGAVRSVTDVNALTDEEMEKIIARISKGDKISFS